jgi:hypothetical protein
MNMLANYLPDENVRTMLPLLARPLTTRAHEI